MAAAGCEFATLPLGHIRPNLPASCLIGISVGNAVLLCKVCLALVLACVSVSEYMEFFVLNDEGFLCILIFFVGVDGGVLSFLLYICSFCGAVDAIDSLLFFMYLCVGVVCACVLWCVCVVRGV